MKGPIKFGEGAHWYEANGKPQHDADLRVARKALLYPSVTSIDKDTFPNLFLERWKLNQLVIAASQNPRQPHESEEQYANRIYELSMEKATEAAKFGKDLHKACEVWPATCEQSLMPWWVKFDEWMNKHGVKPLANEKRVLHHGIGVAGTLDLKAETSQGLIIVDYKTQDVKLSESKKKKPAFYDSWVRQLAFYEQSERIELGHPDPIPCVSLIIDSNEGGEVYDKWWTKDEIQEAYEEFLAGVWLWCRKRDYWPVGKWKMERI